MNEAAFSAARVATDEDHSRAGKVARLYRLVLGRPFDMVGMAHALAALEQGVPFATLVANGIASPEFAQRGRPLPASADDIDAMFRASFDEPLPRLGDAARAMTVAEYAAQLLAAAEARTPTPLARALYPDGFDPDDGAAYRLWLRENYDPDAAGRAALGAAAARLPPGIAVSFVVVDGTWRPGDIDATLSSLRQQICGSYEILAAGGKSFRDRVVGLMPDAGTVPVRRKNANAFDAALERCRGTFVLWLTPGVRLAIDAVCRIAAAAASPAGQHAPALLTDYDHIDRNGMRCLPEFATGWDPETAMCRDDWSRQTLLRTECARAAGGARAGRRHHAWADLGLRVINGVGKSGVHHIPAPLFSVPVPTPKAGWRSKWADWTRTRAWSRLVGDQLGALAHANGRPPPHVTAEPGRPVRIVYPLPREKPLVSIVIPTRDRSDLLDTCLDGILRRTGYAPLEILVVDNCSVDPRTQACFARYASDARVRILKWDYDFNWGAINNFAVRQSNGSVAVLLNNDTDVINSAWLDEMVAQALRPEIGAVGNKLLYRSGSVQHAGLVFGPGAECYHRFRHMPGDAPGYRGALSMVREVSAVTGACLALRRNVYDEVGGIEEQFLGVTWSDVDLCFRVRARGYRVICTPYAPMLHLELATRGADDTPERAARAERERDYMLGRWLALAGEDACYNPNLWLGEGDTRVTTTPRLATKW